MSDEAADKLRTIAGQVLNGSALDSFVEGALMSAFTNEAGEVEEEKVMGHLTAIHAAALPQQPPRQWGQSSGQPAGGRAGDVARAALKKRHGVGSDDQPTAASRARGGENARAALARRHGVKGRN
jgi:hypothetical protein